MLRQTIEMVLRLRPDEMRAGTFADATERVGRQQRDVVAALPQRATDPDERVHIAARADWRQKEMRDVFRLARPRAPLELSKVQALSRA